MRRSLLVESKAHYKTDRDSIRQFIDEVVEEHAIDEKEDELAGRWKNWTFDLEYEWEIEPGQGYYELVERQYVSLVWYGLLGTSVVLGGVGYTFDHTIWGAVLELIGILLFVVWGTTLTYFILSAPNVVNETRRITENHRNRPALAIMAPILVLLVVIFALMARITLTEVPRLWAFLVLWPLFLVPLLVGAIEAVATGTPARDYLPDFAGDYIIYVFMSLTVPSLLVAAHLRLNSAVHVVALVLGIGTTSIAFKILKKRHTFQYKEFLERKKGFSKRHQTLLLAYFATIAYVMVYMFLTLMDRYWEVLAAPLDYPLPAVTLVVAVLPFLYILLGLFFQTLSFVLCVGYLYLRTSPLHVPGIDSRVRELTVDGYQAGSYSIGVREYIFVSSPVLEEFDDGELRAVLAHEEAHVRNKDTLLSFVIPFLSLVTLTGKNAIYTLIDFRGRELAADAYAAETVGRESLKSALERFSARGDETLNWLGITPNFTPFSGTFDIDRFLEKTFGAFFGGFALAEAHPTVEERMEMID